MSRAIAMVAALGLLGCASLRQHREDDAPGIVDVEAAPKSNEPGKVEEPRDPGERFATFNPGVFGGGGYADGGAFYAGLEVSVNRGTSPRSHYKDGLFIYPLDGYGVSLGWDLLRYRDSNAELGPLYLEYQRFRLFLGGAIGYSFDPDDSEHGPQVSVWMGPWFARSRYLFGGGGFEIFTGIQIKVPMVSISSR
jgi:hypothetical protein